MCTSKPKVPKATPVIERQAYRSPVSREALGNGGDANARRRRIAGIETSTQGVTEPASTTRNVMGGSDQLSVGLGGGGGTSIVTPPASTESTGTTTPTRTPQTGTASGTKRQGLSPKAAALVLGPISAMAYRNALAA